MAAAVIDVELVDRLVEQADAEGAELLGPGGLLTDLTPPGARAGDGRRTD
jgi:hypothetical protein